MEHFIGETQNTKEIQTSHFILPQTLTSMIRNVTNRYQLDLQHLL